MAKAQPQKPATPKAQIPQNDPKTPIPIIGSKPIITDYASL